MPQISVEYSVDLSEGLDRRGFALAFHSAGSDLIGSALGDFKTRFTTLGETVIGAGGPDHLMVHVAVEILPGRSEKLKARLGELALDLITAHLTVAEGLDVQVTVEVRDLDGYHKAVLP
jgi:5-carboxymethyl-2-hydroxymuconate isomerase